MEFDKGIPIAVNGTSYGPADLLRKLDIIGGRHGVVRVDFVVDRDVGIKSRGVYGIPCVTLLHTAHRAIESLTMDREVMLMRNELMPECATMIYRGHWNSPDCALLRKIATEPQLPVSGTARLELYKGNVILTDRKSPGAP